MPELPEVETICRGLRVALVGKRLIRATVRRSDLRQPIPADFALRVGGRFVEQVARRAKYILVHLEGGTIVLGHLGMSGRLQIQRSPLPELATHDHVVFDLRSESPSSELRVVFNDPRRFGLLLLSSGALLAQHPLLRKLGPEPLEPGFTSSLLRAKMAGRRGALKAALLDQTVVAGLGNIYVSEALFRARLSPERPAGGLSAAEGARLCRAIREVLNAAITAGGSSISDYVQADGESGAFQNQFQVYDRADLPCCHRGCRGRIRRIVQAGRATYFCPRCQR